MDSRARQLIEALGDGWSGPLSSGAWDEKNLIEQAAAAYDKLAEQAQKVWDVEEALDGNKAVESYRSILFKQHAAELRAMIPAEKTQLEKDVEILREFDTHVSRVILYILEQLKQGKE